MEEKQDIMRHSMSHVLAKAVGEIFSDVKYSIGPAIADGFYYDFDIPTSITPEDFDKIDQKMREIINANQDFVRKEISRAEALKLFKDQPYKLELLKELPDSEIITIYTLGDNWFDLCRGPHVENTKMLRSFAFKLNRVSGAYFKGDEKNKMLQRVYVYGFDDKQKLKEHLKMLEEAMERDHRKIGPELDLFMLHETAQGMPYWLPKGLKVFNTLIDFWRIEHQKRGYEEFSAPQLNSSSLWKTSGHWDHYKEDMFVVNELDGAEYALKPMSCPSAINVYQRKPRSYKELPLRFSDIDVLHRNEKSGQLNGLFRVRMFRQDDSHNFISEDQIRSEIKDILEITELFYGIFDLDYSLTLSTRPESFLGEIEVWNKAEDELKSVLDEVCGKGKYNINEGDGAFYGPKIDIHMKDCLGRQWQMGTIQLDFQLPMRFDLTYTDNESNKKVPIIIHRVIYGSLERFIGILIEHFAGEFPFWIAPVQVGIVPVMENHNGYAKEIREKLESEGIKCELNMKDVGMGKKVNEFRTQKVPYTLILGDKEMAEKTVSIKIRGGNQVNDVDFNKFKEILKKLRDKKALQLAEEF